MLCHSSSSRALVRVQAGGRGFLRAGLCLHPRGWLCFQADDLDGEIDLRSCTDVTEFAVQRNYGFQIHVSAWRAALRDAGWDGRSFPICIPDTEIWAVQTSWFQDGRGGWWRVQQTVRVQPAAPLLSGDRVCVLSPLQTKDAIFTLSAMTSGIRRNWIEALRKNVRPVSAPDVTK